jgi:formamidopyrimidine-DNA glycosylase
MPELPEIETIKVQLAEVLPGRIINKVEILKAKSFIGDKKQIEGKKVVGVERKAKLLLIELDRGVDLAIHFKMTGQLIYVNKDKRIAGGHPTLDFVGELPSKHTRVIFHLDQGTLFFNDQRIFGWIKVVESGELKVESFWEKLGPEPFDLDEEQFIKIFIKLKQPIKLALMDQAKISGVGNIYANDACWEAKVNPRRLANSLTRKQYTDLYFGVIKVLNEGIKFGGATAADAKYIDLHGLGGHYQDHFRVYDREGEMCLRNDDGIIHKLSLGGRGTYFCPACQR